MLALVWAISVVLATSGVASGQSNVSPAASSTVVTWEDFATQKLRDPWDMRDRTDLGWFTWGVDQPTSHMTGKRITTDAFGQTVFSGTPSTADPSVFFLDTPSPNVATIGKDGGRFPIDTTRFTHLLVKMRFANEVKNSGVVMQVYFSRNTIYHDASARPTGGTYLLVDGSGNQVGIPFNALTSQPFDSAEGGHYVIYSIPLGSLAQLQALNPNIAGWKNVNSGLSDASWGGAGITADSFRFKPMNATSSGQVDIDWARLVSIGSDPAQPVTWSGGGTYDIVVSSAADCGASTGNYAVIAYGKASGAFSLNPQTLPNGVYYVGVRDRLTNGADTPASRLVRACSSGAYTVVDYPAFAFTAPSPDGSADDFATVFLNNPWDFATSADVDASFNIPALSFASVPTEGLDGASLGTQPLMFGTSASAATIGDPYFYTLFSTARGLNNRIDTSRYRLFTTDFGVNHARDLVNGSIMRIIWHIAGENWFVNGASNDAENVTMDIPLRSMQQTGLAQDSTSAAYVLDKIQADLADRTRLPLVASGPSTTGWSNTATQCTGGAGCTTSRTQPFDRAGVDNFRLDPHEFANPTEFYFKRARLAAHEKSTGTYGITWTSALPPIPVSGTYANAANWKVRLYAVRTSASSASTPIATDCSANLGVNAFPITTNGAEPTLASGAFTWNAAGAGLTDGALYFICAGMLAPGSATPTAFTLSQWPIIYKPTASSTALPRLFADRTTVWMSAQHNGSALATRTAAQTVRIIQSGGSSAVSWLVDVCENNGVVCSGSVSYIDVVGSSGSGTGSFTVQVKYSPTLPISTGSSPLGLVLRIREASGGTVDNSPQYIQLHVNIYSSATDTTKAPMGQVDVPIQNATGIQGAIGVSGWVVDDVGIASLSVYRNCVPAEPQAACVQNVIPGSPSTKVVYIGSPQFVPGARPDVEAGFPNYPQSNQAGFGYAILTNMLPVTSGGPFATYGGHGPITFYVVATDLDGHTTVLGRDWTADHNPTSITMDNNNIAKPFGVIDTPTQGGPVTGMFANFGWAITPDTGSAGISIPNNGSTMFVFIDGVALSTVNYNQCRGNVGNPPGPGVYCNDDVASIFGNSTPQPPLTPRFSNPSRFRNLDAGRGPQGSFDFNSAVYANGLHSIAWSVTDSANRTEGIGSRYFIVTNGVSSAFAAPAGAFMNPLGRELGSRVGVLAALEPMTSPVGMRLGYSLTQPYQSVSREDGIVRVRTAPRDRIEIGLPGAASTTSWEGYVVHNGRLTPLPVGSHLDAAGRFSWQTEAGFFGDYDLIFVREHEGGLREALPVRVTLRPSAGTTGTTRTAGTTGRWSGGL